MKRSKRAGAYTVNMRQISRARRGLALCELAKALRQHGDLPLVDPQTPRKLIRWRVLHGKRKKWQALLKLRCWVVGPLSLARRPPPRVAIRLLPETPPHQLHSNYHSSRPCALLSRQLEIALGRTTRSSSRRLSRLQSIFMVASR